MAKKLIKNYFFTPGKGLDQNLNPNAYSLILQNRSFIIKEIVAYIQNKIDEGDPDYVGYTYSVAKCERDSGYVVDALLSDIRYGGNEQIIYVSSQYWDGEVPQVDGNRIPEYESYQFARDLINNNILPNVLDETPEQGETSQVIDLTKTAEAGTTTSVTTLLNNLVAVIQNGLSSLPSLTVGLGQIEVLGKVELEDLLLISNVTDNNVIYNFADPTKGGTVEFLEQNTENYPQATTVNNGVTIMRFKTDTSSMSSSDSIQIFLESTELKVRPYDFGTDALERMRVGLPQAMLDADFEYGLQPTKWQAIGMQRGYPATFEISATDVAVVNVITDASTGTGGVGSSLITVTTVGPHGFTAGEPFTIRALAASITGFNRAEGTFIVNTVPTATTFTYYAKAKVGTSSGQVLATTTTQLREAGFYTGANVGNPQFTVVTNGSSGSFTTTIQTVSGDNILTFTGSPPSVGAPLTGSNINTGTQVTGVFGPANSDGIVDYRYVKTTVGSGVTSIDLTDVTLFSSGMAVGNGGSPNLAREITDITGSTLTLGDSLAVGYTGDQSSYTGAASPIVGTGSSLTLEVAVDSGTYTFAIPYTGVTWSTDGSGVSAVIDVVREEGGYTVTVTTPGSGFAPGDTVTIAGTELGGASPANDLVLTLITVDGGTGIETFSQTGNGVSNISNGGSGYARGDTVKINGSDLGGVDTTNDLWVNIAGVSGGVVNQINLVKGTGTGTNSYTGVATTNVGSQGTGATWTVTRAAGVYTLTSTGVDAQNYYYTGNRFTISGTQFEGASPANDCTITVDFANGVISSASASGTALRGDQIPVYATVSLSEGTTGAVASGETITYSAIALIEISFGSNHGFVPGMGLNIGINSDDGSNNHSLAGGPFAVEQIPTASTVRYAARAPGTINTATIDVTGTVYVRPDSFFSHRPFDGGVQLGTGGPQHGGQAIRQSKKYIRYQSGKGAMYNTGALFAPSFDIRSITAASTASGSLITVITDDVDHGLQAGAKIRLSGVNTTGYNGEYTVNEIIDERTFRITAQTALGNTTGEIGSQCQMALYQWHGAVVRSGPFDDQNGIFFQYDGNQLAVVRRTSTFQCAGTIAINADSNAITGTNTRFLDQLQEGDRIVIRGMTHVVASITNNTTMYVTPDFRGVNNITGVKISKVEDLIIPQSDWNLDKCDGTGPSGYNIDVTKMQMIGIQFSWYGAGFIDWMFRGANGDYVFCHRLKGNNLNTEAYMRTGNLPVRYEVLNEGARTRLNGALDDSATTITVDDATLFPTSGTLYVDNEMISYTGKTATTFTGCTRAATLTNFAAGAIRTYSAASAAAHNNNQGIVLISSSTSPIISHWGSAYMIDGMFDEDRGYIFSYVESELTLSTAIQTAFLLRLAPSVSNAVVGDLGEKELLNRAQLLLKSIEITSDGFNASDDTPIYGGVIIEGVINPQNYPENPGDVIWSGLSGLAQGGQPSFAQIAAGGSIDWGTGGTSNVNVDVSANLVTTLTNINRARFSGNRDFRVYLTELQTRFGTDNSNFIIGMSLGAPFGGGAVVESYTGTFSDGGGDYHRYNSSVALTGTLSNGATFNVTKVMTTANRNFAYLDDSSWESSNGTLGTPVTGSSSVTFPANTSISNVQKIQHGANFYYLVTFNNTYSGTLTQGVDTIQITFSTPAYAQPGETVFSFIAQAGEHVSLDLSELKELTNTTIGGRGTFPNGPDVLAINVYKTSGEDTTGNIILRWGEAQA